MLSFIGRDPITMRCLRIEVSDGYVHSLEETDVETDLWIAPGLVDLQVNGYREVDLNGDDLAADDVLHLTDQLQALGTTTYLPTIVTAGHEAMLTRLRTIAAARQRFEVVRDAAPWIHLEGPWISPMDGYRGAHPPDDVRAPSIREFDTLQEAAGGHIRLVTLSPHWPESPAFIAALRERGVCVALGHTHASSAAIRAAVTMGAGLSTHLGNGIASELPRHPNPIWSQLAQDHLMATFIADGVHVAAETLRVMLRAKGVERSVLVSDSVALAGSAPGIYRSHIGGTVEVSKDGSIRMSDTGLLAGSGIALKDAVARAPGLMGCSLGDAVRMASTNPAAAIGLPVKQVAVGARADLLLFSWQAGDEALKVHEVLVRGVSVRKRP